MGKLEIAEFPSALLNPRIDQTNHEENKGKKEPKSV